MKLIPGQLVIILAPYMDYEIYSSLRQFDDNSLVLEMKSSNEVPFNKDILCIVIDDANIFEFYTQVIAKDGNLLFVKRPELGEFSAIEKRKFNRVDYSIGFVASPIAIGNVPLANSDKKFTGMIKNISGGGVMIETDLKLPPEMTFAFKLKLNFFLDCKARVIRTIATEKNTYQCGCEFVDNSLENIKSISLFAFKEKLRMKRKELNQRTEGGNI
jgi:hypothetical protein